MSSCPSDQKLTSYLNENLATEISKRYKCVSNSMLLQSNQCEYIAYFARGKQQQLFLVLINVSKDEKKETVKTIPVVIKSKQGLETMAFQIQRCPFTPQAFSVVAYDPRDGYGTAEKIVFLTGISLDSLQKNSQIQLTNINLRQYGLVKDIKWYSFAALTLLVLTDQKLLIYKLDRNSFEPGFEIQLKDLNVKNSNQVIKKDYFEKIGFAQNFNQEERYSSFGKKLSLYLISNTGSIYMFFPFINFQVILDGIEERYFREMNKMPTFNKKRENRFFEIIEKFRDSNVSQLREKQELNQKIEQQYSLNIHKPQNEKIQLFKLNPVTYNKSSVNGFSQHGQQVQVFKVITLAKHTVFFSGLKTKSKEYEFKVQILSQEPYQKLINDSNYSRPQNFNIQTVGQIRLDKSDEALLQGNGLRVFYPTSTKSDIYLIHNNLSCYRISFNSLISLLKNSTQNDDLEVGKLIDVDVLFESKTKVLTVCCNDNSIYVIQNNNQKYSFESIPLHSIELKQRIRQTIEETQNLFRKLVQKSQIQQKEDKPKPIQIGQLKQESLIDIEKKLENFTTDYRKSVQIKLQRIKRLYESIQSKNKIVEKQQNQKRLIIDLVNQAEQNDKKIKDIVNKQNKGSNRTQEDMKRRIRAADEVLDWITGRLDKQNEEVTKDASKLGYMRSCDEQADAAIGRLQNVKDKLLAKRDQLKRQLGKV